VRCSRQCATARWGDGHGARCKERGAAGWSGVGWADARRCRDTNASEEIFGDVRDVEMSVPVGLSAAQAQERKVALDWTNARVQAFTVAKSFGSFVS
jgi:hypothetical protein